MNKLHVFSMCLVVGCLQEADIEPEPAEPLGQLSSALESAIDVTGVNCSTEAVQALIQPTRPAPDIFGHTTITVDLPAGAKIRLCDSDADGWLLHIHDTVHIRGNGARLFVNPADIANLLKIHSTAANTIIEDVHFLFAVASPSLYDHDKIGIDNKAHHLTLRDVRVTGSGTGIQMIAGSGDNMNWTHFDNVQVVYCRRAGLVMRGLDVSGGYFAGLRVLGCQDYRTGAEQIAVALEESTANGNVYVAPDLEVNDVAMRVAPTGGMAPSTFVGGYVEEGDPLEWVGNYSLRTTVVGGHFAIRDEVKGDRVGGTNSNLTFHGVSSGVQYSVHIPAEEWQSAMAWSRNYDAADMWLLKGMATPPGATSRWGFQNYYTQAQTSLDMRVAGSPLHASSIAVP